MTLLEKVNNSANIQAFTMYKEGLFYKCYNEDAMVFSKRVKAYKVSSKYVKSVGAEVLSLGFPASEVDKGNLAFEMISEKLGAVKYDIETQNITFCLKEDIKQGFESWKNTIVMEKSAEYDSPPNVVKSPSIEAHYKEIIALIKQFDLANSTPMQGLNFIQQLKKEVQRMEESYGNI